MRLRRPTPVALTMVLASWLAVAGTAAATPLSPIEPRLGSFKNPTGIAIDQATGNVYVPDGGGAEQVQVLGPNGEAPVGGGPASFTGEGSPSKAFNFGFEPVGPATDPTSSAVYIPDVVHNLVDKYVLNAAHEYEYVCEFTGYEIPSGASGCTANGGTPPKRFSEPLGVAVDSLGDVYIADYGSSSIYEFNAAGEELHRFPVYERTGGGLSSAQYIAVDDTSGTIYATLYGLPTLDVLKRSSLTGGVESEEHRFERVAVTGVAVEEANRRLIVDFGDHAEVFDSEGKPIATFGQGVIREGRGVAIDEATHVAYVVSSGAVQRFDLTLRPPTCDDAPAVASHITNDGQALLEGVVNPEYLRTTYHFEYGLTTAYGMRAPDETEVGSGGNDVAVSQVLGDLQPSTTYHFALVATNAIGTTVGEDGTFTTPPASPPNATTGGAEGVTHATARISGTVDPAGLPTVYIFEYGTTTAYGTAISGSAGAAVGSVAESAELLGLGYATTYHYRLVAVNEDGVSYGADGTFTTLEFPNPFGVPPPPPLIHATSGVFPTESSSVPKPRKKAVAHKRKGKRKIRRKRKVHGKKHR